MEKAREQRLSVPYVMSAIGCGGVLVGIASYYALGGRLPWLGLVAFGSVALFIGSTALERQLIRARQRQPRSGRERR